jgi:hypothetical protein
MTFLAKDIRDHIRGSVECLSAFEENIYVGAIPQKLEYEQALVINIISQQPEYYLGGEAGTHITEVQIDVWVNGTPVRANEQAEKVRNRLSGYRGTLGEGCYGTIRLIRNNEIAEPPVDGSNAHKRRISMDFEIIHSADVPTFA